MEKMINDTTNEGRYMLTLNITKSLKLSQS
jgi:hypothetical protein